MAMKSAAIPGCKTANIIPTQYCRSAARAKPQRFLGAHRRGSMLYPLQEHGLACFSKHVTAVVAGAPVHSQSYTDPGIHERPDRGDARTQTHL